MQKVKERDLSLNEVLALLGLTTRPGRVKGTKDILHRDVVVLQNKRARDVWLWLDKTFNNQKKESAE